MTLRLLPAPLALGLCLGLAGAEANPLPLHGGFSNSITVTTGAAFACDAAGTGVCADHSGGRTFVQWPDTRVAGTCDLATGTYCTDYTKRYRVVRSIAGPVTASNYGGAVVIGSYDLPNSGQLPGGNPDVSGGASFTIAHRMADDNVNVMQKIPDANNGGLKLLPYATGLQVYTALGSADAYYGVVETDLNNGSPVFIGGVGPITESVAPQDAIQYAHRTGNSASITSSVAGYSVVFGSAGALGGGGGTAGGVASTAGDYYSWFGDTTEGWQDGQPRVFLVRKDSAGYPSLVADSGNLIFNIMDNIWNSAGNIGLFSQVVGFETSTWGLGLTPNPLVGPPNRYYPMTENSLKKQLTWLHGKYNIDLNRLHWYGVSLGAFAAANPGLRMRSPLDPAKPLFSSAFVSHPGFRVDLPQWRLGWSGGGSLWGGTLAAPWPFSATVAAAPSTLGTTVSSILMADGSKFEDHANVVSYVAGTSPAVDLPFYGWMLAKDDTNLAGSTGPGLQPAGSWVSVIDMINAMEATHRGYTTNFYMGPHDTGSAGFGTIFCDWTNGSFSAGMPCYKYSQFRLDRPYIAFDHSSINDNPGTGTRDAFGIYDGDVVGVMNAGFTWNVTTDTAGSFVFTVGNNWMGRNPTFMAQSTITGSIAGTGGFTVGVTSTAGMIPTGTAPYFRIGNEITGGGPVGGGSLTQSSRGLFGTTKAAHSAGETVTQYVTQATGPNGGPYTTMTANMTPRRAQGFRPAGAPTCTYTPSGGSPTAATVMYLGGGVFTILNVPIAVGVTTSVSCS